MVGRKRFSPSTSPNHSGYFIRDAVIRFYLGGPTFPQSVRFVSATGAPGNLLFVHGRSFLPGNHFSSFPSFLTPAHILRRKTAILYLDPLFLSPSVLSKGAAPLSSLPRDIEILVVQNNGSMGALTPQTNIVTQVAQGLVPL
jgi:hypothetical protein